MRWSDVEEIAEQLDQTYPDVDPRDLLLAHLERMILELPDFHGEKAPPDKQCLARIQKEWDRIRSD